MFIRVYYALCCLAVLVGAHMKMNAPVPYGRSTLNNSPLLGNGEDFPCKQRPGVYAAEGASNVYALGSTNPLTFIGQAVHGGGSCQVSITYDNQPTKDSVWKVIKSIEGGCPAQNQTGNMGDDASAADPFEYKFTIPSNIPVGNGTISWTWFNKIGNREMYMNCGPLTLTGASGSQASFDALPDMFKANIHNGCDVPDNKDVVFPNPGGDVSRLNGATNAFATPTGVSCGAGNSSMPTSTSLIITKVVTPSPTSTAAQDNTGAEGTGTLCSEEGTWNCIGGDSFQRCVGGMWSMPQQLAEGTSCTPGKSTAFQITNSVPRS